MTLRETACKIDLINSEEAKLRKLNMQIKELPFAKGPRDEAKIRELQIEAKKTANRINIYDKQLFCRELAELVLTALVLVLPILLQQNRNI